MGEDAVDVGCEGRGGKGGERGGGGEAMAFEIEEVEGVCFGKGQRRYQRRVVV